MLCADGLGAPVLAEVTDERDEHRGLFAGQARHRELDRELGAVEPLRDGLGAWLDLSPAMVLAQARRDHQIREVTIDHVATRVPEHVLGGRVDLDDATRRIHLDDAFERRSEQCGQPALAPRDLAITGAPDLREALAKRQLGDDLVREGAQRSPL